MTSAINTNDWNQALLARLQTSGQVAAGHLERGLAVARAEGARLDRILLKLGLMEEELLIPLICGLLGCRDITSLSDAGLDPDDVQTLTLSYLNSHLVAPLRLPSGERIIASADPANKNLAAEIAFHLGREVKFDGATTSAIRRFLGSAARHEIDRDAVTRHQTSRDAEALRRAEIDGPVIKFVQEKLTEAVLSGASDLHFESTEAGITLRYRINGVLIPQRVDPDLSPASVLARLKVMAEVNVAERRLPQDGRMDATIAGRKVDFRFSSLPTQWGESIVCRVLDPKALRLGWERLGFSEEIVTGVKDILAHPSGLFLVTGPTGSGKTTTLYTALAHLNTPRRKIVTVEDPVEYNLPGVQQIDVHEEIGLTFARALRGILRHDPNVILIGEIRDQETAEIAVRAAQVGRLVLSTLHTNAPEAAVTRLVDLGVPEFLVRDVLRGVLGQELQIVPCPDCGGAGCIRCGGTGTGDRKLTAELLFG